MLSKYNPETPSYYYCISAKKFASESCFIFMEASGLDIKIPNSFSPSAEKKTHLLVLKHGLVEAGKFWRWILSSMENEQAKRIEFELSLHGPERLLAAWQIKQVKPLKAAFVQKQQQVIIEQLEVAFKELCCIYPVKIR